MTSLVDKTGPLSVAIGDVGNETRIATVQPGQGNAARGFCQNYVPLPVAAGTRLSTFHSGWSTCPYHVGISGVKAGDLPLPPYKFLDLGPCDLDATTSAYGKGAVVPGATVDDTPTPWTELTIVGGQSTPNNLMQGSGLLHDYAELGFMFTNVYNNPTSTVSRRIELAYGSPGSEVAFAELDWRLPTNQNDGQPDASPTWVPWGRPAGDRISARYKTTEAVNDPGMYVTMMGLR
ncbi:hypothetical protein DL239_21390 [Sedimentitalea sp. CY04]|uniref:Uncharacterized protein n=1 Tax=Parasedimentitalea denitrificans TaxID=2211118 RepID=A0ABX0WFE2_9RHOB|nr:hypothetical protein [Sedimentitalea sp. CY04]